MTAEERAESFDNGKADWKDLPLAFVWSFRILMQQGVYDDFRRPVNNWLSILLFMVLFFILMILLLNVFLAMLNQTFSKIMEDTEKQWRVTWAQLILTYDEALLSEYYEKLRHGRNPSFPISRIGFPRKSDNFLNDERQTALLEKRLGYKAIPFIKRLFGYLRHSFVHHSTFYHYCIIFEFREDSELPIRMIASADVNSPLSGKWQVSSLKSLENGKIEPPVKRNARKKGPSYPRNKSRGRYEMERTVKGKGVGEDIV
ncbi:hypothetical protein BC829DRAFT_434226 [Chytridium lagenaria]|nr:hypothetical protein BC829DRAFT_434226 [Chytridium lagenaria]